jgi:hypothetical protein
MVQPRDFARERSPRAHEIDEEGRAMELIAEMSALGFGIEIRRPTAARGST